MSQSENDIPSLEETIELLQRAVDLDGFDDGCPDPSS